MGSIIFDPAIIHKLCLVVWVFHDRLRLHAGSTPIILVSKRVGGSHFRKLFGHRTFKLITVPVLKVCSLSGHMFIIGLFLGARQVTIENSDNKSTWPLTSFRNYIRRMFIKLLSLNFDLIVVKVLVLMQILT